MSSSTEKAANSLQKLRMSTDHEIRLRKLHESEMAPLRCRIVLGQAIPKGKNMDLIVQKAVEIGAAEIAPIISDRTIVQLDSESASQKQTKWQQIAIEAAKQCGQNWLPHVHAPKKLVEFFSTSDQPFDLRLIGSLQPDAQQLKKILETYSSEHGDRPRSVLMLVGPEGDFTPAELALARQSRLSADHPRSNHPASRNRGNLLPECSLLRTADLTEGTLALNDNSLLGDRRFDGGFARKFGRRRGLIRRCRLD